MIRKVFRRGCAAAGVRLAGQELSAICRLDLYGSWRRELDIILVREPGVSHALARKVVAAVHRLRELDLAKPPGVAETIDWARTLDFLGETDLDEQTAADTLGAVVKERDDLDLVRGSLAEITSGA